MRKNKGTAPAQSSAGQPIRHLDSGTMQTPTIRLGGFTGTELAKLASAALPAGAFGVTAALLAGDFYVNTRPFLLPIWAAILIFYAAEWVRFDFETRKQTSSTIVATEAVAAFILIFGGPVALIVGRTVGSTVGFLVAGSRNPVKVVYNVATNALECGVVILVFSLLVTGQPTDPLTWLVLFAALQAGALATVCTVFYAMRVTGSRHLPGQARQVVTLGVASTLISSTFGIIATTLTWVEPWSLTVQAVLFAALTGAYIQFNRTVTENRRLRGVLEVVQNVPPVADVDNVVAGLVQEVARVLRSRHAVLVARSVGVDERGLLAVGDEADGATHPIDSVDAVLRRLLDDKQAPVEGWDAGSALVAPLFLDDRPVGAIAVSGRPTYNRRADRTAQEALDALAVQISIHLDRTHLYTETAHQASQRKRQAVTDPVTGVLNARGINEATEPLIRAAALADGSVAAMTVEITTYAEVASTYGVDMADELVDKVSRRIQGAVPDGLVARVEAGRFVITIADCAPAAARAQAERLTRQLNDSIVTPTITLPCASRIGIAVYPGDGLSSEELLRKSAIALLSASRSGAAVERYSAANDPTGSRPIEIAARLTQVIVDGTLELAYQPKVNLQTGRVVGAEALLRWEDPELGNIAPEEVVAVAERTGKIHALTRWVLEQAIRDAVSWRHGGADLTVSVNVSAMNLLEMTFPSQVRAVLDEVEMPPSALIVELTESVSLVDTPRAITTLNSLREMGVGVSIDDFGTGFSSLSHLMSLPATEVKIDKSFVQRMTGVGGDATLIDAVVYLSDKLGLTVVAEGVESPTEETMLRAAGCALAQGFLYAPPLLVDEFRVWLRDPSYDPIPPTVVPLHPEYR